MPLLRDITEIVMAIIGVALIALLVNPKANTTAVVTASGSTLNSLLQTVTLQNGVGGGLNYSR